MKVKALASIVSAAIPSNTPAAISNNPASYIIGGIIALLIMGYLVYTLLHPDKF